MIRLETSTPTRRSRCWRGDLLLALRTSAAEGVATALGFDVLVERTMPVEPPASPASTPADDSAAEPEVEFAGPGADAESPAPIAQIPVPMLRCVSFRAADVPQEVFEAADRSGEPVRSITPATPLAPLSAWPRLWGKARRLLGVQRGTSEVDGPKLVRLLATNAAVVVVPRRLRRALAPQVTLVSDYSPVERVLAADLRPLRAALRRRCAALFELHLPDGPGGPGDLRRSLGCSGASWSTFVLDWPRAVRGVALLASDLGLGDVAESARAAWSASVHRIQAAGCSVALLTPGAATRHAALARRGVAIASVAGGSASPHPTADADWLLSLLYVAVRFDVALLRLVRRLASRTLTAESELAVLRSDRSQPTGTGSWVVSRPARGVGAWRDLDEALQRRLLDVMLAHQERQDAILWAEVVLRARAELPHLVPDVLVTRARQRFARLAGIIDDATSPLARARAEEALLDGVPDEQTREVLMQRLQHERPLRPLWLGIDLAARGLAAWPASETRAVGPPGELRDGLGAVSPLALLHAGDQQAIVQTDEGARVGPLPQILDRVPLRAGAAWSVRTAAGLYTFDWLTDKPAWATTLGCDEFGLYAEFELKSVVQRMRWVPPGCFRMGSPDDERGRGVDEGPVRLATIAAGLWVADTPCTQALWRVVMGGNPSHSGKGETHPVDSVSWHDTQRFLAELSRLLPADDLMFRLPHEDEWEWAVRAGTTEPTYAGSLDRLNQVAWFERNSDSKSQPVARKAPNGFGLYDMLGNVWEWCEDLYESYPGGAPFAADIVGRDRVVRGGGLAPGAASCRAARRGARPPANVWPVHGFRLVRGRMRSGHASESRVE